MPRQDPVLAGLSGAHTRAPLEAHMLIKLLEALAWKALCLAEKVAPETRLEGWLSDVWYAMDVKLRERKRRLAHRRWMELPYIVRGGLLDVNAHQPTEK